MNYKKEILTYEYHYSITETHLEYYKSQKRLDNKTIKAYRIDLKQFTSFYNNTDIYTLSVANIENGYRPYQAQTAVYEKAGAGSLIGLLDHT